MFPNITKEKVMKPSKYQEAIANAITTNTGNLQVGAVAGSGKSTTLAQVVAPRLSGTTCFLAFNKAIATELGNKLPKGTEAKTIHSLAYGPVRRRYKQTKVEGRKYATIVGDFLEHLPGASASVVNLIDNGADLRSPLVKMIDLVRNTLTNPEDDKAVINLANHYDVEMPTGSLLEYFFVALNKILAAGRAESKFWLDFTDMLWLAATDPTIQPKKYDWLLIDECQDLSKAQLAVVSKALKPGGRAVFAGDARQAINGFAGADCDSFMNIHKEMDTTILPLTICYRCDASIIREAQKIVPEIEAREGAAEGSVSSISEEKFSPVEGDMVLCRTNAPLVSLCFRLISEGKPARIKGRDIGAGLISTAKKITKKRGFAALGWENFGEAVQQWLQAERVKLEKRKADEGRFQALSDRAECLTVIWSSSTINTLRDFEKTVKGIFSDDRPGIQLSSVHRSKGLENERVYIIRPELLPGPWAEEGTWQYEQEINLKYVAITRAKHELVWVR